MPPQFVLAAITASPRPTPTRLVLEVSDEEVFVRSQALAEAEDAEDAVSVDRVLGDPEDSQTVPWEDVKHKLEP